MPTSWDACYLCAEHANSDLARENRALREQLRRYNEHSSLRLVNLVAMLMSWLDSETQPYPSVRSTHGVTSKYQATEAVIHTSHSPSNYNINEERSVSQNSRIRSQSRSKSPVVNHRAKSPSGLTQIKKLTGKRSYTTKKDLDQIIEKRSQSALSDIKSDGNFVHMESESTIPESMISTAHTWMNSRPTMSTSGASPYQGDIPCSGATSQQQRPTCSHSPQDIKSPSVKDLLFDVPPVYQGSQETYSSSHHQDIARSASPSYQRNLQRGTASYQAETQHTTSPSYKKDGKRSKSPSYYKEIQEIIAPPKLRETQRISSPAHQKDIQRSATPSQQQARQRSPSPACHKDLQRSVSPSPQQARQRSPSPSCHKDLQRSASPSQQRGSRRPTPSRHKDLQRSVSPSQQGSRRSPSPSHHKDLQRSASPSPQQARQRSPSPSHHKDLQRSASPSQQRGSRRPTPSCHKDLQRSVSPSQRGSRRSPSPSHHKDLQRSASPSQRGGQRGLSPSCYKDNKRSASPSASKTHQSRPTSRQRGIQRSASPSQQRRSQRSPSPSHHKDHQPSRSPSPRHQQDVQRSPSPSFHQDTQRSASPLYHKGLQSNTIKSHQRQVSQRSTSPSYHGEIHHSTTQLYHQQIQCNNISSYQQDIEPRATSTTQRDVQVDNACQFMHSRMASPCPSPKQQSPIQSRVASRIGLPLASSTPGTSKQPGEIINRVLTKEPSPIVREGLYHRAFDSGTVSAPPTTKPHRLSDETALEMFLSKVHPNKRIIGEIAYQLDRRILNYVFNSGEHPQRRRFFAYSMDNIPQMMEREAIHQVTGDYSPQKADEIQHRYDYIVHLLQPLGFSIAVHSEVAIEFVNRYGLLPIPPDKATDNLFVISNKDFIRKYLQRITAKEDIINVLILYDCLISLAKDQEKPIFIW